MYSHTRAHSIANRVGRVAKDNQMGEILPAMHELMRVMACYVDKLGLSVNENKPHAFAIYLLELATAYNSFYRDCHVVKDGVVDEFNYAVSEKARELLRSGMIGVGIIPLESM
jgi:arginyl-tRNA synthetase